MGYGELTLWIAILVMVLGVLLMLLEIFVFPGFGMAGFAGLIMLGYGIFLLSTDVLQSLQSLLMGLLLTLGFFAWAVRLGYKRKIWHRLALKERQSSEEGYSVARSELKGLVGKKGTAVTKLRPSGTVEIDGMRIDVVSEGDYITAGTEIIVVKVDGTRVIVRPVDNH